MFATGSKNLEQQGAEGFQVAVPFTKMQAIGNDFVFIAESDLEQSAEGNALLEDLKFKAPPLVRKICDRHFGVGADGVVFVLRANRSGSDFTALYFNADGSGPVLCGNAMRCVALYAHEKGIAKRREFVVWNGDGHITLVYDGPAQIVSDIGEPVFESTSLPVAGPPRKQVLKEDLEVAGRKLKVTCVGVPNPHCVAFNAGLEESDWREIGAALQKHEFFPQAVNVEFADTLNDSYVRVFVWERGSGPTLACASGAAGVLVAGVLEKKLKREAVVELPGGKLLVSWCEKDNHVRITGPAEFSYKGVLDLSAYMNEANTQS